MADVGLSSTMPETGLAHTDRDHAELVAAGVDPGSTQHREHPVACWCLQMTRHQAGACDRHYQAPRACTRQAVSA